MTIALTTPPASEPLGLPEIKLHLRIDHDHEDALLNDTLKAARQYTEFASGTKLITQAWRQYESSLPLDRRIPIQVTPIQQVSTVTIFGQDGSPNILASQEYGLQRGVSPDVLEISSGVDASNCANGVEIDLIAGISDLGIDIPDTLKRAILLLIAHWYEFRGAISPSDQPVSIPPGFDALIMPFKRGRL